MCWTEWGRLPRIVAAVAVAAQLGACNEPAGEHVTAPVYGDSLRASMDAQAGHAGGPLARDFRASAEPTVTFAFDSAALDAAARDVLDGQARWLLDHTGVRMTVTGHADLVGPESYNYGLGLRRAHSVRDYLVAQGVSAERLDAVESLGERDPVVPIEARERRNRRAVTSVGGARRGFGLDGVYAARLYDNYQAGNIGVTEAEPITVN
jgi:outer membrane protein OmpA-like peptidoglycan-associated protein